jgi:hypothetical protein
LEISKVAPAIIQLKEELQADNSREKLGPFSLLPGPALGARHCSAWANPPAARNERCLPPCD